MQNDAQNVNPGLRPPAPGAASPAHRSACLAPGPNPPLTLEQSAVFDAISGPVRILAGAGKTTIDHRTANQVRTGTFWPEQMPAVTVTRNTATWLLDHLARQGIRRVAADTSQAAALQIVRRSWSEWRGTEVSRTVKSRPPHIGATSPDGAQRALVAWLDGPSVDDGTAAEVGMFAQLIASHPERRRVLVGISTDLRAQRRRGTPGDGINLFVHRAIATYGRMCWSLD